jgi:hypothetical protein
MKLTVHGTKRGRHTVVRQNITTGISIVPVSKMQPVKMDQYFNDKVTNIFKNQYLSPRPATVTLQLPTQGIGEWTHPMLTAVINDSGFRAKSNKRKFIHYTTGHTV